MTDKRTFNGLRYNPLHSTALSLPESLSTRRSSALTGMVPLLDS